jgi:hypothetical protein
MLRIWNLLTVVNNHECILGIFNVTRLKLFFSPFLSKICKLPFEEEFWWIYSKLSFFNIHQIILMQCLIFEYYFIQQL